MSKPAARGKGHFLQKVTDHRSPESDRYVHKTYRGRLGNQLFQWASALGLAARRNATACFGAPARGGNDAESSPEMLFDGRFTGGAGCPSLRPCAIAPTGDRCWRLFAEQGPNRHDDLPVASSTYTGIVPPGFLQSFRYFDAIAPLLRKRLRFKKSLQVLSSEALSRVRRERSLAAAVALVGVHVRRGDKTHDVSNAPGSKTNLVLPSLAYWQHAMRWHRHGHKTTVHFVVVSDDLAWCKEQAVFQERDVTLLEDRPAAEAFALLACCDHAIISIGTFGWWAGWLTGGVVTYYAHEFNLSHPSSWAKPVGWRRKRGLATNGRQEPTVRRGDYYPPEWVAIHAPPAVI